MITHKISALFKISQVLSNLSLSGFATIDAACKRMNDFVDH
ncbi:MAG: hypothetical protein M0T78_02740 [Actinomycetota bacterium]|nr:hypothetical protein [Actinomycetota bacterium]